MCWISLRTDISTRYSHLLEKKPPSVDYHNLDLLGDEPPGLAALPGIRSLQEQQLGLMEDVHQHREFSVDEWLQTLLESVDDILDSPGHTQV